MNTLEMELALMRHFNYRMNIIVPNTHWGLYLGKKVMHECDLLVLTKSGYAGEIEIKVSKTDLLKDKFKKHGHVHPYIKNLWFAVPDKLKDVALSEIPERAGLIVVHKIENEYDTHYPVRVIRKPIPTKRPIKWNDEEIFQLMRLGVIRNYTYKGNILKYKNKIKELKSKNL